MDIIKNQKLINRNAKIGQFSSLFALLILLGGMVTTFVAPELFAVSISALLIGFLLSQVGIYFGNRWGRRPRTDERLDASLKGLGKEYSLYHYVTPASHLLVGPAGLWILMAYYQRGTITYEKNRWKQRGGGFLQSYLRIFAQESIGRPDLEANAEINGLNRFLQKTIEDGTYPPVQAVMVFTDERVQIEVEEAPLPALPAKKLKDFIRKQAKAQSVPPDQIDLIRSVLPNL